MAELAGSFDVVTTVKSGGVAAQADAVKMGIARALVEFNPELRKLLKAEGLMTRDARQKERKKYGQKGAASGSNSASANALAEGSGFRVQVSVAGFDWSLLTTDC